MPQEPEAAQPMPVIQPPLEPWQLESLFISLVRHRLVRDEARQHLRPRLFSLAGERFLEIGVELLFALCEQYPGRERVPYTALLNAARDRVVHDQDLSPDQARMLTDTPSDCDPTNPKDEPGIIYRAYKLTAPDDVDADQGRFLLKQFLLERDVYAPLREAVARGGTGYCANYAAVYDNARAKMERIEAISRDDWQGIAAADGLFHAPAIVPTGISFLDDLMGGGTAAPECLGLLGGLGQGKSTLMSQLAVSQARIYRKRVLTHGEPLRDVLLFSYEDDVRKWRIRTVAYAAGISRTELVHATPNLSNLSRTGHLKQYERDYCKKHQKDEATYPGEYERFHAAVAELTNIRFLCMDQGGLGTGGAEEVAAQIARKQEKDGILPGCVLVDSLDLLVENYLAAHGNYRGDLATATRLSLDSFVHRLRRQVAVRFDIPVWMTNQLAGANLKKSSGVMLSHADALGSKTWAKGLDFHFAIGLLDEHFATNCHCSKARRTGDLGKHKCVRLVGEFGHWRCIDDGYVIHNNVIVAKDVLVEVEGPLEELAPATEAVGFEDSNEWWSES